MSSDSAPATAAEERWRSEIVATKANGVRRRRGLIKMLLVIVFGALHVAGGQAQQLGANELPNVIYILADDLGYGDLGSYGHPTIRTPNLDRMAREGMKFTQFYVAASICTPSRAALLTGRLPVRSGMGDGGVLWPYSAGGLPDEEVTIAEALKTRGYATATIGKWHLGHLPEHLPMRHGFDYYFGVPYSNGMGIPYSNDDIGKKRDLPPIPLLRGGRIIEQSVNQETLTRRYTEEALAFIEEHRDDPFFLFFAHTFPHTPLHASERFRGRSLRGLYGDVVEELDWSAGQIIEKLQALGLAEKTLVVFTSDNGPWLLRDQHGGSAGPLRGGKSSTWEGGFRVPMIALWPGSIAPGAVTPALATTMDLFSTALDLAGVTAPKDRIVDGVTLIPLLRNTADSVRQVVFYYRRNGEIYAVRKGPWKVHFVTQEGYGDMPHPHEPPLLFHLEHDPSEQYNVADEHPAIIKEIRQIVEAHLAGVDPAPSQLEPRIKERPYLRYD